MDALSLIFALILAEPPSIPTTERVTLAKVEGPEVPPTELAPADGGEGPSGGNDSGSGPDDGEVDDARRDVGDVPEVDDARRDAGDAPELVADVDAGDVPDVDVDRDSGDDEDLDVGDDDDDDDGIDLTAIGEGKKKKKKKKIEAKLRARVVAGVRMRREAAPVDDAGEPLGDVEKTADLQLRQARVRFSVKYLDRLSVKVSAEFADLLGSPGPGEVIRDAWGNVEIHPAFQIKVGNFKRPYSRLELRGVSKVPVIGRGLFNGHAIEDLGWGDRAVGVGLWGKIKPKRRGLHRLSWAVTASNDAISGAPEGVDTHARVTYDPIEWLSIGVGGAYKYVQDPLADEAMCQTEWTRAEGCRRSVFGASADLVFRVAGLYASVEANLAQDWLFADESPLVVGALAYASYDFEVGERTRLQPVLFGEFVDANMSFAQSEAVRTVAGFNVLWTKHLRVMPQFEWIKPLPPVTAFNPFTERWVLALWVSVQL